MDQLVLILALMVPVVLGQQPDIGDIQSFNNVTLIADWKEHCRTTVGEEAIQDIEHSGNHLMECVKKHITMKKLQREVDVSIERGELDVVFKKYCKKRDKLMACAEDMFVKLERCANESQKQDLNITRKVIDAGIDFVCHNDGDRIALFMAEKGEECLKNHSENIKLCLKERVPDLQGEVNSMNIDAIALDEKNCKKLNVMHQCVVKYTGMCDDPTPANILGSLITQMLKVTPCWQTSSAPTLLFHTQHLLPHLLTLMAAALAAANILL